MTSDQIGGIVRALLTAAGGWLIGQGWLDAETWLTISGVIVTIVGAGWSWWTNRPAKIVETVTAAPKDMAGALTAKAKATGAI